jgi:hypothetical protein
MQLGPRALRSNPDPLSRRWIDRVLDPLATFCVPGDGSGGGGGGGSAHADGGHRRCSDAASEGAHHLKAQLDRVLGMLEPHGSDGVISAGELRAHIAATAADHATQRLYSPSVEDYLGFHDLNGDSRISHVELYDSLRAWNHARVHFPGPASEEPAAAEQLATWEEHASPGSSLSSPTLSPTSASGGGGGGGGCQSLAAPLAPPSWGLPPGSPDPVRALFGAGFSPTPATPAPMRRLRTTTPGAFAQLWRADGAPLVIEDGGRGMGFAGKSCESIAAEWPDSLINQEYSEPSWEDAQEDGDAGHGGDEDGDGRIRARLGDLSWMATRDPGADSGTRSGLGFAP